jgi:hypothetical protein
MSDLIKKSISSASSSISGALQNPKLDPRVMLSATMRGALSIFKDMVNGAFGIDLSKRIENDSSFVDQMTQNLNDSTARLLEALDDTSDSSPESVILKSMVGINNAFVNNAKQMKEDVKDGVFSEEFKNNLNSEMTNAIEGVIAEVGDSAQSFGGLDFNDEFLSLMSDKISRLYGSHETGRPINAFSNELSAKFLSSLQDVGNLYTQTSDATMIEDKNSIDVASTIRQLKENGVPEHIVSMVQTSAENDAWDTIIDNRIDMKIYDHPEVIKYGEMHPSLSKGELYDLFDDKGTEQGRWFSDFREELHKKDLSELKHQLTDGEIEQNKSDLVHLKQEREHQLKGRSTTLKYSEEMEHAKRNSDPSLEPGL